MANILINNEGKSESVYNLSFDKVPGGIVSVNVYIALSNSTGSYVQVKANVPNVTKDPGNDTLVTFSVAIEEVQALSPALTWENVSFMVTPLFFRVTSVDSAGVESVLADASTRLLGPVGIYAAPLQDNPASFNQNMVYSPDLAGWVRIAASANGALSVSTAGYNEENYVIEREFSGTDVISELIYKSGAIPGSYAKLIQYEGPFVAGVATKTTYSDSVVPVS